MQATLSPSAKARLHSNSTHPEQEAEPQEAEAPRPLSLPAPLPLQGDPSDAPCTPDVHDLLLCFCRLAARVLRMYTLAARTCAQRMTVTP